MNANVLLSGGVDSTACINFLLNKNYKIKATFIDYGQPPGLFEKDCAREVCKYYGINLKVLKLAKGLKVNKTGEIIGRNAFLIFSSLMYSGNSDGFLTLGIHARTPYYDCSKSFLKNVSNLVTDYTNGKTRLLCPFVDLTKRDVFDYSLQNGVPIHLTRSCESGSKNPCGKCASCRDRLKLNVK